MNAIATALSQKRQLYILSKIIAALLIKSHTLQLFIIWGGAHVELSEQSLQVIAIS